MRRVRTSTWGAQADTDEGRHSDPADQEQRAPKVSAMLSSAALRLELAKPRRRTRGEDVTTRPGAVTGITRMPGWAWP